LFPREADLDLYRAIINRHGSGSKAARYAQKVIGRVQGHTGGPSLAERRVKWEEAHPMGISGRTFRPDDFAFVVAAQLWGDKAQERCAELGMHPKWLGCVRNRFSGDMVEVLQLGYNARIFTREMLGALIRAQLPGKLCEAETPLEWQRIVNTATRLPDWVLNPAADTAAAEQAALAVAARTETLQPAETPPMVQATPAPPVRQRSRRAQRGTVPPRSVPGGSGLYAGVPSAACPLGLDDGGPGPMPYARAAPAD
jgi:hypothetical protein